MLERLVLRLSSHKRELKVERLDKYVDFVTALSSHKRELKDEPPLSQVFVHGSLIS